MHSTRSSHLQPRPQESSNNVTVELLWVYPPYLSRRADDHAVIVSHNAVKLLHGKLVLHVRLVTSLLKYIHANLHSSTKQSVPKIEVNEDAAVRR